MMVYQSKFGALVTTNSSSLLSTYIGSDAKVKVKSIVVPFLGVFFLLFLSFINRHGRDTANSVLSSHIIPPSLIHYI